MGFRFAALSTTAPASVMPANSTETVVFALPQMVPPTDSAIVALMWNVGMTPGTGCTSFRFNLRRGFTVSDPLVNATPWIATVAVGSAIQINGFYFDVMFGQFWPYCLTIQQITATVASTLFASAMHSFIL